MNEIKVKDMLNLNGLVFYVINIQDLPLAKYIGRTDSINGVTYDLWISGSVRYATTDENKGLARMQHLEKILLEMCDSNTNNCYNCSVQEECSEYSYLYQLLGV